MALAWYEQSTRALITEADALELQARDPDAVLHLPTILLAPEFPYHSNRRRTNIDVWPTDRCVDVGRWAIGMFAEVDYSGSVMEEIFRRLSILGLSATLSTLRSPKRFSSFTNYKDAIAAPVEWDKDRFRGRYADFQECDYIERAYALAQTLGHKPRKHEYVAAAKQGTIPGYALIREIFGGIDELNDRIGFPNYSKWDADQFINFGIEFVRINGSDVLVPQAFDILGKRGRGPWVRSITTRFAKSWTDYKARVLSEYRMLSDQIPENEKKRQCKLGDYRALVGQGILPPKLSDAAEEKLLRVGSRYMLIRHCAPAMKQSTSVYYATTNHDLRQVIPNSKHSTYPDIELAAVELGVIDDIWPISRRPLDIRLNPDELKQAGASRRRTSKS